MRQRVMQFKMLIRSMLHREARSPKSADRSDFPHLDKMEAATDACESYEFLHLIGPAEKRTYLT